MFIFTPQIRRGTKQNEQINSHSFGEKTHDPSECDRFTSNTRRSERKRYTFEQRTAKLIGIKAMFSHRFDVEIKINIKCALILMGS